MPRGRRKDLTIPPSQRLIQQCDYRARKAQYVKNLEIRAKKAEEENVLLRKEVQSLQATLRPELVRLLVFMHHRLADIAYQYHTLRWLPIPTSCTT